MDQQLKAPFPWYGGKSRIASEIWRRLGTPDYYIEPFAGSLAVLLARPNVTGYETVNDADCFVTNFWRATKHQPRRVVRAAIAPLNEVEMRARHRVIQERRDEIRHRLLCDPEWFSTTIAGWWLHGVCGSFGGAWLKPAYRQKPSLKPNGLVLRDEGTARVWMEHLRDRLCHVRVCCGDWLRVLTPIELGQRDRRTTVAAVVLDPPYADVSISYGAGEKGLSRQVHDWAIANATNSSVRIALCGYEDEHEMPKSWECIKWASLGGLARHRHDSTSNRFRERIWFSPSCLKPSSSPPR